MIAFLARVDLLSILINSTFINAHGIVTTLISTIIFMEETLLSNLCHDFSWFKYQISSMLIMKLDALTNFWRNCTLCNLLFLHAHFIVKISFMSIHTRTMKIICLFYLYQNTPRLHVIDYDKREVTTWPH